MIQEIYNKMEHKEQYLCSNGNKIFIFTPSIQHTNKKKDNETIQGIHKKLW